MSLELCIRLSQLICTSGTSSRAALMTRIAGILAHLATAVLRAFPISEFAAASRRPRTPSACIILSRSTADFGSLSCIELQPYSTW